MKTENFFQKSQLICLLRTVIFKVLSFFEWKKTENVLRWKGLFCFCTKICIGLVYFLKFLLKSQSFTLTVSLTNFSCQSEAFLTSTCDQKVTKLCNKKKKMFNLTCAFGTGYISNALFQKTFPSWAAALGYKG